MTSASGSTGSRPPPTSVQVGCSGWQYKHWRGDFYAASLPASRWLAYYATQFGTVEINSSFYRLPEGATFARWREGVSPGFVYAVKASRFLTHMRKLREPAAPVQRLFERAVRLEEALGPVLYQLPPRWPVNLDRLHTFLEALPVERSHVIEFRDPSWYVAPVYKALNRHGVALCLHDMPGAAPPERCLVGPFVYTRFHGPAGYGGRYADETLADWAEWYRAQIRRGIQVYAYFNNDIGGHAPRDAKRFRRLLGRPGA
jgi:uncharacterized protein YecE (DUF72 family)